MTQRKLADKVIKKKAKELATHPAMGHDSDKENKILKGIRWARDYDPWFYVEDGELPHVEQSSESFMRESSELIFIDKLEYSIETGNFVVCDKENKSFFDNGSDVWEPSEVKCFMPIPERQK